MEYEITGLTQEGDKPEVEGVYDNPKLVKADLEYLRKAFPRKSFRITRDGEELTEGQLQSAINAFDIEAVIQESTRLPANYRRGKGTEQDDVAIGSDGNPTKVWAPDNPEDCYE